MDMNHNRHPSSDRRAADRNDNLIFFGGLLALGFVVGTGWYFLRKRHDEPIYHVKPVSSINEPIGTYATGVGEDMKGPAVAVKINAPNVDIKISTASGVTSVKAETGELGHHDAIRKAQYDQMKQNLAHTKAWKYKDGVLRATIIKALDIDKKDNDSDINPLIQLRLGDKTEETKSVVENLLWNETFEFQVKDATRDELIIQLFDRGTLINDKIGDQFGIAVMDVCKKGGVIENFVVAVPGTKTTKLIMSLVYHED